MDRNFYKKLVFALATAFIGLFFLLNIGGPMFLGIIVFFILPLIIFIPNIKFSLNEIIFTGIIGMMGVDIVSHYSGIWVTNSYILNIRLQNNLTIDSIFWGIAVVLFILVLWKNLNFDLSLAKNKRPKLYYFVSLVGIICVLIIERISANLLDIKYFYLLWGIPLGIFAIYFSIRQGRKFLKKILILIMLTLPFSFLFEYAGMKLSWWTWLGNEYIAWIKIFGIRFPIEETIIWFILFPMIVISFYYYFGHDKGQKK